VQHLVDDGGRNVIGVFPRGAVHGEAARSDHAATGGGVQERAAIAARGIAPVVKLDPTEILANVHTKRREPILQRVSLAVSKISEERLAVWLHEPARCFVKRVTERSRGRRV
jgi:shikimate kinase